MISQIGTGPDIRADRPGAEGAWSKDVAGYVQTSQLRTLNDNANNESPQTRRKWPVRRQTKGMEGIARIHRSRAKLPCISLRELRAITSIQAADVVHACANRQSVRHRRSHAGVLSACVTRVGGD